MSNECNNEYLSCQAILGALSVINGEFGICCDSPKLGNRKCRGGESVDDELIADWRALRKDIVAKLNSGTPTICLDCVHLRRGTWPSESDTIATLNIADTKNCNLTCSYCISTQERAVLEDGIPDNYVLSFLRALIEKKYVNQKTHLIFSVGEPFIQPFFPEILCLAMDNLANMYVSSNLTVYCRDVEPYIEDGRIGITVSIDAGTRETYRRVRGRDLFNAAAENVIRYSRLNPSAVFPKYICLPGNCTVEDRDGFLELVERAGVGRVGLSYDMLMDAELPTAEVVDFYGDFKHRAGRLGLAVDDVGNVLRTRRDLVYRRTEAAYRKNVRESVRGFFSLNTQSLPIGNGRLEHIIRAQDQGLWVYGWAYDKGRRRTAREVIVCCGGEPIFGGVCRWRDNRVSLDEKTAFSFHSSDIEFADKVLAAVGRIEAYARFDDEWFMLQNTSLTKGRSGSM